MGVTLDYKTRAPIVADIRDTIQAEVQQLASNHDWWCEPIWFCNIRGNEGELEGWNKIYLPGYTTSDGGYVEVDFEEDLQEWIEENWAWIFEFQLSAWTADESAWPAGRDLPMFRQWFRVDLHSVVVDVADDDIEGEEL